MDCLRDGENGLLVQPGDIPAQAAALHRLIADAGLRTRLAEAALEECRRTYSWSSVGQQIMGIYETLRGTAPRAGAMDTQLPHDAGCRFRTAPHLL